MRTKHQECREAEIQLRRIEERLGMTPSQYDMPASPATMLQTTATSSASRARAVRQSTRGTPTTGSVTLQNTRATPSTSNVALPNTRGTPVTGRVLVNGQATTPTRSRRSTSAAVDANCSPSKRPRRS